MAELGRTFNSQEHNTEQADYSTLPLGIYQLEVTASDVVPTKAGTGTILKVTYEVTAPEEFKSHKIFGNLNLENPNAQAAEIGQRELASLCRSIGISALTNSEELHFHTFTAKVGLEKPQPGYSAKNKITRFYFPDADEIPEPAIDAAQPTPAPANDNKPAARAAAPAAARPAAAAGSKPWGKPKAA
jgi:hypothetical protein